MHRAGWLHRDLKPSNILFDPQATLHLGDFGFAARKGDARCKEYLMTASHAAPEVYAAKRSTLPMPNDLEAADVYALGATLLHVVVGKDYPFSAPPGSDRGDWLDQRMAVYITHYEDIAAGKSLQDADAKALVDAFQRVIRPLRMLILNAMNRDARLRPSMAQLQQTLRDPRYQMDSAARAALSDLWNDVPRGSLQTMEPVLEWLAETWRQRLGTPRADAALQKVKIDLQTLGFK